MDFSKKLFKLNKLNYIYLMLLSTLISVFGLSDFAMAATDFTNTSKLTTQKSYSNNGHSVQFNIPNLIEYGNVRSNNNGLTTVSRNGDNILVNVNSGTLAGYDKKEISQPYYSTTSPNASMSYNSDGYTGTLTAGDITSEPTTTWVDSGYWEDTGYYENTGYYQTVTYIDRIWHTLIRDEDGNIVLQDYEDVERTKEVWVSTGTQWVSTGGYWVDTSHNVTKTYYSTNYTGTVQKPYYQYEVSVDYTANRKPELDMSLDTMHYSRNSNQNSLNIKGKIRDMDILPTPDTVNLSFTILDSEGKALPNYTNTNIGTFRGSTDWSTFENKVMVDEKIPDGKYKLIVTATDRENENTTYTSDFYVDSLKPNIPEIHLSKEGWTIPTVSFTVTDKGDNGNSGISKIEYQINNDGNWITYVNDKKVEIPSILKGKIPIEVRAIDKSENVSESAISNVYIDNIPPIIESVKVVSDDDDTQKLVVTAKDNETSLKDKAYKYYVKEDGKDTDYKVLTDWTSSNTITLPKEPYGAKFSYYVEVRDLNDNIAKSSSINYVTSPKLKFIGVKPNDFDNAITIEFERNYTDGPVIEIYREDSLVAVLKDGSTYVDENLDYDRDYNYKFITVVGEGKDRVESKPVESKVSIGKPTLEMKLDSDKYYTTPFTDNYNITGAISYRKGGKTKISLFEDENNEITSLSLDLVPQIKSKFKLAGEYTGTNPKEVYITGDLDNDAFSGLYKRTFTATVSKKSVTLKNVTDYSKYSINKQNN